MTTLFDFLSELQKHNPDKHVEITIEGGPNRYVVKKVKTDLQEGKLIIDIECPRLK